MIGRDKKKQMYNIVKYFSYGLWFYLSKIKLIKKSKDPIRKFWVFLFFDMLEKNEEVPK